MIVRTSDAVGRPFPRKTVFIITERQRGVTAAADLSHLSGSCAQCKRSNLQAQEFFEAHLRQFIAERATARSFKDARIGVHAATKKMEVAGPSLFCRACIERQRDDAAASDSVWNDSADGSSAEKLKNVPHSSHHQPSLHHEQEQVADSWEDD